ncbi:MAG: CDP-alcohol phosphatidyltransferase family protein [Flavobacteriales bacterium]
MFGIANLLTSFNLLGGICSIIFSLSGRLDWAVYALAISALLDFLDGFVARFTHTNGLLGKQLDSLADLVSFGVAPGILMFVMIIVGIDTSGLLKNAEGIQAYKGLPQEYVVAQLIDWKAAFFYGRNNIYNASIMFLPFVALIIPFFALFRLAKFNIDERQSDKFIGVPTPTATIFFAFFPLYFWFELSNWSHQAHWIHVLFDCYTLALISALFSVLMVTELPLLALKFKNFKWHNNQFRYVLLIGSLISILLFLVWAIPIIVILYLILSIIENFQFKKHEIQS